jgi:PAS domain S-box-containing protein
MDGYIIKANENFCKLVGCKEGAMIKKPHSAMVTPEYAKSKEYVEFWETLRRGESITGEFERVAKDGSKRWLYGNYTPIRNSKGGYDTVLKIATDITKQHESEEVVNQKNSYLLKIEAPLRMLEEGLKHTQKVYSGVKEFTNLVKEDVQLDTKTCDLKQILKNYLSSTSYTKQVVIDELVTMDVNEPLFCTAVDNLIRNGLKYNDSGTKSVMIFMEDSNTLCVQDNGRGMTQYEFDNLSKPYVRKKEQAESGSGLGLNICIAILKEHGFDITAEKCNPGTKLRIRLK